MHFVRGAVVFRILTAAMKRAGSAALHRNEVHRFRLVSDLWPQHSPPCEPARDEKPSG